MQKFIVLSFLSIGIYLILSAFRTSVPARLKRAIKLRNETGLSDMQQMLFKLSTRLSKHISLSPERKKEIEKSCHILNMSITPEFYMADLAVTSAVYSIVGMALMTISIPLGAITTIAIFAITYAKQKGKLKKLLIERREAIEKELPQMAGTIRQQLTSTRDIVSILSAYRKVCGQTLKDEMTKTLNDIKTSSVSSALQGLERRIGSAKLSELVRGLLGVYRGEDQIMFFEFLTEELTKAQTELVVKELEQRPSKLTLNFALLGFAFFLMAIASLSGSFSNASFF